MGKEIFRNFIYGHRRKPNVFRIIILVIGGICIATLFALVFGWVVMLLWNWLMPAIFGIKTITYWQAFGITVLAKILLGGVHGNHGNKDNSFHSDADCKWHKRMGPDFIGPSDQTPGAFSRDDMRYYREFWDTEGKNAFGEFVRRKRSDNMDNRQN